MPVGLGTLQGFPVALPIAGDRDLTLRVISPSRVPIMDAGEILQSALRVVPGAVFAVFDKWERKLYVATASGSITALRAVFDSGTGTSSLRLTPDGGQSGVALQWSLNAEDSWTAQDLIARVTQSVKPRMSVFAVLNLIASHSGAQFAAVDQQYPSVMFRSVVDDATLRAALADSGAEIAVEIAPPTQTFWP